VLGEPDDPGVVLGRTAVVAERELLDPQHPRPGAELGGDPVQGRGAQPAESDDDRAVSGHPLLLLVPGGRGAAGKCGRRNCSRPSKNQTNDLVRFVHD
jgi:hypothetical protein